MQLIKLSAPGGSRKPFKSNEMFFAMLLIFGAVLFISSTDIDKLREFINKEDESDKF